jgi:hypothetical protein
VLTAQQINDKGGNVMTITTIGATLIILAESISFNPVQFTQDGDTLCPTGKYMGNGIIQADDEYYCTDAYNVNCEYLTGDANADGEITVADLVILHDFVYNGKIFDAFQNADTNLDSYVSSDDIDSLQSMLIAMEDNTNVQIDDIIS